MIDRRELLTLGGLLGVAAPANGEALAVGQNESVLHDIANELKNLRTAVTQPQPFGEIAGVRDRQFEYLRGNGKFPDFIDVGVNVWISIYDWHVRERQQLMLSRDSNNGRYIMMLNFTGIVLHQEALPNFIGIPYDLR